MQNDQFKIIQPSTEKEWMDYYRIRYEVLRKPWNQPEKTTKDDAEDRSVHWMVLTNDNSPVATGRLQLNEKDEGQIRSMAVHKAYRNRGLGCILIQHIEMEAKKRNLKRLVLDAREGAVNFYLKNGYEVVGNSYLLFGVIPHFSMQKIL